MSWFGVQVPAGLPHKNTQRRIEHSASMLAVFIVRASYLPTHNLNNES